MYTCFLEQKLLKAISEFKLLDVGSILFIPHGKHPLYKMFNLQIFLTKFQGKCNHPQVINLSASNPPPHLILDLPKWEQKKSKGLSKSFCA